MNDEEQWENYRKLVAIASEAIAQYERLDNMTRVVKAVLMKASGEKSAAAQEREAYAHPDYITHLNKVYEARKESEWARGELELKRAQFEFWRTSQANKRAELTLR